jgi:phosphonatase-like hydrolase
MNNSKVELIVFDMAGTTVRDDREVEKCFLLAADKTGLKAEPDRVVSMMGLPKIRVFEALWAEQIGVNHLGFSTQVESSFVQFKQILEDHYSSEPVEPTEGCLELFDWLRSHQIKIALTTGFYRSVTDLILQRLGWDLGLNREYLGNENSIVQISVTPSEIFGEEGRPAPYMIQKAMYKLGIKDTQKVIAIGDTPSDLQAGINANCLLSCAVTNGTHRPEQLVSHHGDRLFANLIEFQRELEQY